MSAFDYTPEFIVERFQEEAGGVYWLVWKESLDGPLGESPYASRELLHILTNEDDATSAKEEYSKNSAIQYLDRIETELSDLDRILPDECFRVPKDESERLAHTAHNVSQEVRSMVKSIRQLLARAESTRSIL